VEVLNENHLFLDYGCSDSADLVSYHADFCPVVVYRHGMGTWPGDIQLVNRLTAIFRRMVSADTLLEAVGLILWGLSCVGLLLYVFLLLSNFGG
jgi:hypothetical protein